MKDGMTISALHSALREKKLSSYELTINYLEKIKQNDAKIGAFLSVFEEQAIEQAKLFDLRNDDEKWNSPLAGIAVAIKDNLTVKEGLTTCASNMLSGFVPPYDATAAALLKRAGAVILGKTNMDEFGMGSTTEYSAFHPTRNPISPDHVPGGSSGGSAAAVAADMAPFALGTDTGGSVRLPASYCGLVGMRPTYGAVSRFGLVAFCSSMDTVGPITKTVADNAMVLGAIAHPDGKDATSVGLSFSIPQPTQPLRVGIISELMEDAIASSVKDSVQAAADCFSKTGAAVKMVSIAHLTEALFAYYMISSAEASSNLARFDGVRYGKRAAAQDLDGLYRNSRSEGFGDEVKRRIRLGTYVLTKENKEAYYERSIAIKKTLEREFLRAFSDFDILLCPTAPDTAPKCGQFLTPTDMYRQDLCTVPMSLAGLPALSVPFGKDENGLPIGVQLVGKPFSEGLLYYAGQLLEKGDEK